MPSGSCRLDVESPGLPGPSFPTTLCVEKFTGDLSLGPARRQPGVRSWTTRLLHCHPPLPPCHLPSSPPTLPSAILPSHTAISPQTHPAILPSHPALTRDSAWRAVRLQRRRPLWHPAQEPRGGKGVFMCSNRRAREDTYSAVFDRIRLDSLSLCRSCSRPEVGVFNSQVQEPDVGPRRRHPRRMPKAQHHPDGAPPLDADTLPMSPPMSPNVSPSLPISPHLSPSLPMSPPHRSPTRTGPCTFNAVALPSSRRGVARAAWPSPRHLVCVGRCRELGRA